MDNYVSKPTNKTVMLRIQIEKIYVSECVLTDDVKIILESRHESRIFFEYVKQNTKT